MLEWGEELDEFISFLFYVLSIQDSHSTPKWCFFLLV